MNTHGGHTVEYAFELRDEDGTLETFEGAETVDGSRDRACDSVERWMRDTYGDLAAFSAWLAD